ncbi:MAG: alpha-xylosidase [Ancalomicrobiaceae bacterium]|nr:alpha-xylosidase [Ancalomicrobiaceae bacterium]
MKFSDGVWRSAQGVAVASPHHTFNVEVRATDIVVHASSCLVRERFEDQETKYLAYRIYSPAPNVIGIHIEHHRGGRDRGPAFALTPDPAVKPVIVETEEFVSLTSGELTVQIETAGDWRLDVIRAGRRITGSALGAGGYAVKKAEGKAYVFERLDLGVGDLVYGLGERFTAFTRNGQVVDIWNRDGGTSTEQAYKNIPFFLTNRGWGVLVNEPDLVSFEVGSEIVSKVGFSVEGESLDYLIIDGPTPNDVLDRYTRLTGRPALPPQWSFGLWLSTSFTTNYDEATVNSFVDGMAARDIPLAVFHFDCFWMRAQHWCDFVWDPAAFPDPDGMLARLKAKGLHICVWINPYIAQRSHLFDEGKARGYFLKRPDGSVWQWDHWQSGMAFVDFTNPEACAWYASHLQRLVAQGVDCFKTDFGERIPTDVVYHDGSDPEKMHNYYTFLYNQLVFDLLKRLKGEREAIVFARSATVGGQQFPVHWGGDNVATYESMAESLRGGLSLGLSGFGFWSHDIGGFQNTAAAHIYKRWCAFGLLSSHSRLHGFTSYRVPWAFDEEAVDVLRAFVKLKARLMPYLYGVAAQAAEKGLPMMRAMLLEFPDDPAAESLDRQYMLGPSLLVAPVFSQEGDVQFYLPDGRWTHVLSGEVVEGGRWRKETHDFMSLPLYARPNSLIVWGGRDDRPDYDYTQDAVFAAYGLEDGGEASASIPDSAGEEAFRLTLRRDGGRIVVSPSAADVPWTLQLPKGLAVTDTHGTVLAVTAGEVATVRATGEVTVRL